MSEVVQIKLREAGKITHYLTGGMKFKVGEIAIVEADRGLDYGQVLSEAEQIVDADLEEPLRKVIRKANQWDLTQIEKNRAKVKEVMTTCTRKVQERKLQMKLIDGEFAFDRSKIVFYFTAEGRVDFRDLVKDLANAFKTRIELKQIGVRDEARMLGGLGPCGRALCCATYLKDFEPVTIKMAKEQNLPLNPTKISGLCGRLMCCLGYEHKTYKELMKGLPREGERIATEKGQGKVISVSAIKRAVMVELEDGKQMEVAYGLDGAMKPQKQEHPPEGVTESPAVKPAEAAPGPRQPSASPHRGPNPYQQGGRHQQGRDGHRGQGQGHHRPQQGPGGNRQGPGGNRPQQGQGSNRPQQGQGNRQQQGPGGNRPQGPSHQRHQGPHNRRPER